MSHRSKIIKEHVDVLVTAANQHFKQSFDVDKHASKIIAIQLTSNQDGLMYFRGSQKISINEIEIYPENYESKVLMQGINVPAKDKLIPLDEEMNPGNRKVEIDYLDEDHPNAPFQPYRVRLYVYSRIDD